MGVSAVHGTGQRARAPGGWGIASQNRASRAAVPASSHASHMALGEWTHDTCPSCFLGCRPGRARLGVGGRPLRVSCLSPARARGRGRAECQPPAARSSWPEIQSVGCDSIYEMHTATSLSRREVPGVCHWNVIAESGEV